jgi:poly-gamma-glutamate synthesis protein (capsule biosynthesis protein)
MNPSFLTLVKNHIDQGVVGLDSTMKILEKNEISYCGVGNTLEEAGESWIK